MIKRRKQNDDGTSSILFIPCPPLFADAFQSVVHILDSDVFLILIKACLFRTTDDKAQLWSEAILTRVRQKSIYE